MNIRTITKKENKYKIQGIDLIGILENVKNPKHKGFLDYSRVSYCSRCEEKKPKEWSHCDTCGRMLRHRPNHKKAKYWDKELRRY